MKTNRKSTSDRKRDHIKICLEEDVDFQNKTNGFDRYEFEHYAITELTLDEIDLSTSFFEKKISYPFLISCMTGGTKEAERINEKLAIAARDLNIPIGVGSQRQALEDDRFLESYKTIRKNAGSAPVLGNIGAAEVSKMLEPAKQISRLVNHVEADAMVVHVNPLQELMQIEGNPDFRGFLKNLEIICNKIDIPIIVKEVGAGISSLAAERLLNVGVRGIDVAGAGGTSWSAVEMIRKNDTSENYFWNWGLPTSYCLREIRKLKDHSSFLLIGSGGISNPLDIAKAIALGADICASARPILTEVVESGVDGVKRLLLNWFADVKKFMYLINCKNITELNKVKLIRQSETF